MSTYEMLEASETHKCLTNGIGYQVESSLKCSPL